jgi:hypothetical protein
VPCEFELRGVALISTSTLPPAADFYASALPVPLRENFLSAFSLPSLEGEIALVRIRLMHLLTQDPDNDTIFLSFLNLLTRLIKTNHRLSTDPAFSLLPSRHTGVIQGSPPQADHEESVFPRSSTLTSTVNTNNSRQESSFPGTPSGSLDGAGAMPAPSPGVPESSLPRTTLPLHPFAKNIAAANPLFHPRKKSHKKH